VGVGVGVGVVIGVGAVGTAGLEIVTGAGAGTGAGLGTGAGVTGDSTVRGAGAGTTTVGDAGAGTETGGAGALREAAGGATGASPGQALPVLPPQTLLDDAMATIISSGSCSAADADSATVRLTRTVNTLARIIFME